MTPWHSRFPDLAPLLAGADHVDVHVIESEASLRAFVAGMMRFEPAWVRLLYRVRAVFVRLLGMRQGGMPHAPRWRPDDVPMTPGERASFFNVRLAEADRLWAVDFEERHLRAALCVVREARTFALVTIVHYRHWTGRLYFNVIRPFHHLVVRAMGRAGAEFARAA